MSGITPRNLMGLKNPKDQSPHQADSQGRDAGRDFTLVKDLIVAAHSAKILSHVCCISPSIPHRSSNLNISGFKN